jgi:plasmid stabilization system protein ParE
MPQLIWAPTALRDLQRLYRFLATHNTDAAQRAMKAIRLGVGVLKLQPAMGRPVEDLAIEFREWIVDFGDSGYVVRYHLGTDTVVVLAVRHQREAGR